MTLQEKIQDRLRAAMKLKDADVVTTLRGVQAAIKNKAIDRGRDLEDSEVIEVLKHNAKQLADSMEDFVKAERKDLVDKTKHEMELMKEFLPTPMERAQIKAHVIKIATDIGATTLKDMGKLMGAVMKAAGAAASGDDVRAEVEEYLKEK
ncbi:GatB/YqeY domain-containing protein [Candidatus Uhrbacteria bacterium]|nr:GatB/YqeY domain-containing protein [Candidatus Uhrbacteria bacterium]